jgi:hypothetical protein
MIYRVFGGTILLLGLGLLLLADNVSVQAQQSGAKRITFNTDTWFGERKDGSARDISLSGLLSLGDKSVLIGGGNMNPTPAPERSALAIGQYNLPQTGEVVWDNNKEWQRTEQLMRQRAVRAGESGRAQRWCEANQLTGQIALDGISSLQDTRRKVGMKKIWNLARLNPSVNCNVELKDLSFSGTGTLINLTGGTLTLSGQVKPLATTKAYNAIGYVGTGPIEVKGDAQLKNVFLFTTDEIRFEAAGGTDVTHEASFVAKAIRLPGRGLQHSVTFGRLPYLFIHVPPLFEDSRALGINDAP